MSSEPLEQVVRNVDMRLARVEQILPTLATRADLPTLATKAELSVAITTLATKAELAAAIAPLATKAELAAAIAPLATKAELAAAIAPLATRTELKAEIVAEGERTRRYFDAVAERLEGQIQLLAEGLLSMQERMDRGFSEVKGDIAGLDRRVMRLEGARRV